MTRGQRDYDRKAILRRDNYTCQRCGFSTDGDGRPLEVAHKLAVADGGTSHPHNLRTLCVKCHSEVDGWEVGDFDDSNRVIRLATYIKDTMDVDRPWLIRSFMKLSGIESAPKAAQLLEDHGML